jgi:hypothetical protein
VSLLPCNGLALLNNQRGPETDKDGVRRRPANGLPVSVMTPQFELAATAAAVPPPITGGHVPPNYGVAGFADDRADTHHPG